MSKNWRLREQQEWQDRGLTEPDYARDLHDPFLFKDMDKAAARILAAIAAGEKIVIFGDYDADGVPGSAILALFFNEIGFTNYDVYIPDRHNEEHGLSLVMVEKLISLGARLIITVDCGITDVKEVKRANELGVAVIITDHHLPGAELPPALAVIDAQRADNTYPFKWLCGAGVAFKLVQALVAVPARTVLKDAPRTVLFEKVPSGWEKWLLDLVAIATVSDMVPLVGENRALVHFGLKVLRKSPRVGLAHLFRELKLKQEFITEDDIGFMIGPRINTASRMSHASQAFFLLTTDDETRAGAIARHLEEKNRERRDQVDLILADLDARLSLGGLASKSLIVAGNENWSLGVLGLAASRVVEKYERPVFLWARNGHGLIKGSCRSDGSVNVVELMTAANTRRTSDVGASLTSNVRPLFTNFGGHAYAGGFSILPEIAPSGVGGLNSYLQACLLAAHPRVKKLQTESDLVLDAELTLDDVTEETSRLVEKLSPFGPENPKPLFLFSNLEIATQKTFGTGGPHLELGFKNSRGQIIPAISFFNCFGNLQLGIGSRLDLAATLEKSYFKSRPELRLRIVDLRL